MHEAKTMEKVRERDDEAALRIRYETHEPPSALAIGQMLQDVTKSFEDYANTRGLQGVTLAVQRLEAGSFFADLIAVGQALQVLYDHKELLAGFVTHIQGVVQIVAGLVPGRAKDVDRRAVQAVAAPVAGQRNVNITINVEGSHNTVTIDQGLIDRMTSQLQAAPA